DVAPRTLREALAYQEAQRLRNQRIRDRYESSQGRHVLVRGRSTPDRSTVPGWLAIRPQAHASGD
ncbi:MAG TPA: hypothetical protein PKO15_14005, partial [Fibrobacteria bacterium]|nr:hypothetical protein [Fibrobacteria bacterium]